MANKPLLHPNPDVRYFRETNRKCPIFPVVTVELFVELARAMELFYTEKWK